MFDRNEPAMPSLKEWPYVPRSGLTKFEQCAKDFTAAWIQALSVRYKENGWGDLAANSEATRLGIRAAEEFCKQMEEREK